MEEILTPEEQIIKLQTIIPNIENYEIKKQLKRKLKQLLDFQKYVILYPQVGVLADLSIGNKNANWEYIKRAYEEFEKRGVEEVFIIGNLLNRNSKNLPEEEQREIYLQEIEELKTNYPQAFKNYFVLGASDLSYKEIGINLKTELMNLRKDFIPTNYGTAFAKWKSRNLKWSYKMDKKEEQTGLEKVDLNLYAGASYFKYLAEYHMIKIPTCSDIHLNNRNDKEYRSGFLILESKEKGIIAHRYGFNKQGVEQILKRVVK